MSTTTRDAAAAKIIKDLVGACARHEDYLRQCITALREIKLHLAMGETTYYANYVERSLAEKYVNDAKHLRYAVANVRAARRKLWDLNKVLDAARRRV